MASQEKTNDDSFADAITVKGQAQGAFSLEITDFPKIPVLIAAPHGGRDYPEKVLENMREPEFATLRLEDRLIDEIAKDVAKQTGASLLVAHAPRAILDLNRSKNDVDWGMVMGSKPENTPGHSNRRARSGLGLVPRRLSNHGEIWRSPLSMEDLQNRIQTIHRPYHAALGKELERIRDHWGAALLVDLHSMPPLKKRYGKQRIARFVVGDRFGASCDPSLSRRAMGYLDRQQSSNSHNRPYAGGFVLDQHAAPTRGLHAMQLEVCRTLYLDAPLSRLSDGAAPLGKMLAGLVRELGAATARLGENGLFAQAAE